MPRGKKKTPRRRKDTALSIIGAVEGYTLTGIVTQSMFRTNPIEFLFSPKAVGSTSSRIGGDGAQVISLPEMLRFGTSGPAYGTAGSVFEVVKKNLGIGSTESWVMPAVKLVTVPIGFSVAKKLTRKPRAAGNRFLKQIGLRGVIKF